eukprot:4536539-Lingulodinium_polyedra.AAC.1
MHRNAMQRNATQRNAMQCNTMQCNATQRNAMQCMYCMLDGRTHAFMHGCIIHGCMDVLNA